MPERVPGRLTWIVVAALSLVIVLGVACAPPPDGDRAAALGEQLRCPVCQAESVADSPSDTAVAIQTQIAEFVDEGWTDQQIIDFYVQRYGRWILLDPPASGDTLLLWVLPVVVLGLGVVVAGTRRRNPAVGELDDRDMAAVDAELRALSEQKPQ